MAVIDPRSRLYVLPPSHFCERARWALDYRGVAYSEIAWPVGLHAAFARRIAEGTTLPILAAGSTVVQGSGPILDWLGLATGDDELERRFEAVTGPLVRQYIYSGVLADSRSGLTDALFAGVALPMALAGRLMWPVTRRIMRSRMDARPALLPVLRERLERELDWLDSRLDGRDVVAEGGFGRADITAASLLAPLARPVAGPPYDKVRLPATIEETLMHWSRRPSLQWVERTYARHRRSSGGGTHYPL